MRFTLVGPRGAITFLVFTDWHLKHVQREMDRRHLLCHTRGAEVSYHSFVPVYEGQLPLVHYCAYLGGKPCYCDASSLDAEPLFEKLVEGGEEAVWSALLDRYNRDLAHLKQPETTHESRS